MHWLYLAIAIVSEVVATSALKAANGFTRWGPSLLVVAGYASAFYFLSLALRTIQLGVAYAIWSGVGVALIILVGWVVYRQPLNVASFIGIALIVAGVIVLHIFSKYVICPQKTRLLFISKSWRSPCSSPVFASSSAFRNCWPRGFSSSVALGARSARSKLLPRCMPSRQSTALLQSSRSNFWPLKPRSSHIVRVATANHQCSRYAVPAASVLPATGELSDADIVRMVKESRS